MSTIILLFILVILMATANWELIKIRRALESRSS